MLWKPRSNNSKQTPFDRRLKSARAAVKCNWNFHFSLFDHNKTNKNNNTCNKIIAGLTIGNCIDIVIVRFVQQDAIYKIMQIWLSSGYVTAANKYLCASTITHSWEKRDDQLEIRVKEKINNINKSYYLQFCANSLSGSNQHQWFPHILHISFFIVVLWKRVS